MELKLEKKTKSGTNKRWNINNIDNLNPIAVCTKFFAFTLNAATSRLIIVSIPGFKKIANKPWTAIIKDQ